MVEVRFYLIGILLFIGDQKAQKYTLLQAKVLAMTAIDVMTDTDVLQKIKKSFEDDLKTRS